MENKSRGTTFGDFVTIRTEGSMQDITVARLRSTVQEDRLPSPPSFKCNVLRESLSVDSQNIACSTLKRRGWWVISVYLCCVRIQYQAPDCGAVQAQAGACARDALRHGRQVPQRCRTLADTHSRQHAPYNQSFNQCDPIIFFSKFFCLLLFKATFTSFFKDKKS
jgi:hypothetical protein